MTPERAKHLLLSNVLSMHAARHISLSRRNGSELAEILTRLGVYSRDKKSGQSTSRLTTMGSLVLRSLREEAKQKAGKQK